MQALERIISRFNFNELIHQKRLLSNFFLACLIFALLNCILFFLDERYMVSAIMKNACYFDLPGLSKICSRGNKGNGSQMILLGSSLLIYPIWELERKLGAECADPNHYHLTSYLDEKLKAHNSSIKSACNLGSGGAMISDCYLLLSRYTKQAANGADWVVVNCAPRDFCDSGMNSPNLTPIFDYLYNDADSLESGKEYLPSIESYLKFFAEHHCYLYKNRKWLNETLVGQICHNLISPHNNTEHSASVPTLQIDDKMLSSLQEYKGRYFAISLKAIEPQLHFLQLIIDFCKEKKFRLVLVNMPLTAQNRSLLDSRFYNGYVSCMKNMANCKDQEICFLDLGSDKKYLLSDFNDSVHLNATGAIKFEDQIVDFISNAKQSRTH